MRSVEEQIYSHPLVKACLLDGYSVKIDRTCVNVDWERSPNGLIDEHFLLVFRTGTRARFVKMIDFGLGMEQREEKTLWKAELSLHNRSPKVRATWEGGDASQS